MSKAPYFSVILCTRNRASLLAKALESIAKVDFPTSDFELVVVDNGSSDDTPRVIERFARAAPFTVQHVTEPSVGLSIARNTAIERARGSHVFFTDDDQLLDPAILREHQRVFETYGVRVVQGKIELEFERGRPSWLYGELSAVLGQTLDLPEGPAPIDLYGGNVAFRRDLFQGFSAFREDLGKGRAGYSEDIEITRRLREAGEVIAYAPGARVFHVIGPDRSTARFFRRNSFEKGYSDAAIARGQAGLKVIVGTLRSAVEDSFRALTSLASSDAHHAVLYQTRTFNALGHLWAYARARVS